MGACLPEPSSCEYQLAVEPQAEPSKGGQLRAITSRLLLGLCILLLLEHRRREHRVGIERQVQCGEYEEGGKEVLGSRYKLEAVQGERRVHYGARRDQAAERRRLAIDLVPADDIEHREHEHEQAACELDHGQTLWRGLLRVEDGLDRAPGFEPEAWLGDGGDADRGASEGCHVTEVAMGHRCAAVRRFSSVK